MKRSSREVEELIRRVGPTKPDWWDDVKLDYPKTLDLSWPKPKRGAKWDQNKNPGQYLIGVVYRQPRRGRSAAKLYRHIVDVNGDNPQARQNGMQALGHVYARFLCDYPRAAYWYQKVARERRNMSTRDAVDLAECYWQLGNKSKAERVLRSLGRGTTKLWAEIGELDEALAVARRESRGNWPHNAFLAAGNAYRSHGRYSDAMGLYRKLTRIKPQGKRARGLQRMKTLGQQSTAATEVYQDLDLGNAKDGTYRGGGEGFRGTMQVDVTIRDGAIEDIKVVKHREDWPFRSLTEMPRRLVERQGVKGVHAVTGATNTSNAIVNATGDAIRKALQ
ncbi:MAG: FMN-binding protein [Victivallales bacterium]|nr:FMN-binding protein [Victivallales bacterium]